LLKGAFISWLSLVFNDSVVGDRTQFPAKRDGVVLRSMGLLF
jgi:hypothetical protein